MGKKMSKDEQDMALVVDYIKNILNAEDDRQPDYDGDLPMPVKSACVYNPNMVPAVTFDGYNIYSANGTVTTVSPEIYNTLASINGACLKNTTENLSIDTIGIDDRIIAGVATSTLMSTAVSFLLVVDNLVSVFFTKLNDTFKVDGIDEAFTVPQKASCPPISTAFMSIFSNIVNTNLTSRLMIVNDDIKLINFTTSFINSFAIAIYNSAREQLTDIIVKYTDTNNQSDIQRMFDTLNTYFASMMGDITYEIGLFVNNFKASQPLFPDLDKISQSRLADIYDDDSSKYDIF